jgi:heterodisulfide reductase subunit A
MNGPGIDEWTAVDVAVIGGGVAGIRAAIDLRQGGFRVALMERRTHLGGLLPTMDRQYPGDHCGMCRMLEGGDGAVLLHGCLQRGLNLPGVRVMLNCSVEGIQGDSGLFRIKLRRHRKGVHPEPCIGCGRCVEVCPEIRPGVFPEGLARPLRWPIQGPLPPVPEWIETLCTRCGRCLEVCPTGAIDLDGRDTSAELQASRVILAPGTSEMDLSTVSQFGHGRYPDVITSVEWERIIHSTPAPERLKRPSDGLLIRLAAFILCAGSREVASSWCSAYCCLAAVRQGSTLAERNPGSKIVVFGTDLRDYPHDGYAYAREKIRSYELQWIRCRPSRISRDLRKGVLMVHHLDEKGRASQTEADLVVLMTGRAPAPPNPALTDRLGPFHSFQGFLLPAREGDPAASVPGIFLAGIGPGVIADQVVEGAAAAAAAAASLIAGGPPSKSRLPEAAGGPLPPGTSPCLLLCQCLGEISGKISLEEARQRLMPHFREIGIVPAFCDSSELGKALPSIQAANPLVVGACARIPGRHRVETLLAGSGIPWERIRVANIRDHICWGTSGTPQDRLSSAVQMITRETEEARAGSVGKSALADTAQRVLILGAGPGGLSAAVASAQLGLEAVVLETEDRPGGRLLHMPPWAGKVEPRRLLELLLERARQTGRVSIRTNTQLTDFFPGEEGYTAGFSDREGHATTLDFGAVIVSTGAQQAPSSYPTSTQGPVITHEEFEGMLSGGISTVASGGRVIMLQCVGSRCDEHPYCSRICCPRSLQSAMRCRQVRGDLQVEIWYRDLMMPGLLEVLSLEAREKGIRFQRIEGSRMPRLVPVAGGARLEAWAVGGIEAVAAEADLVVLGVGMEARHDSRRLADKLGIALEETGFFRPADPKWRPTSASREGIFLAGSAAGPRRLPDALLSGMAAAQGAARLLSPRVEFMAARVDTRRCVACHLCVRVCPAGARSINPNDGTLQTSSRLCRGCGMCARVCPSGAARTALTEKDPVLREVENLW